jgi:hypothetical protein
MPFLKRRYVTPGRKKIIEEIAPAKEQKLNGESGLDSALRGMLIELAHYSRKRSSAPPRDVNPGIPTAGDQGPSDEMSTTPPVGGQVTRAEVQCDICGQVCRNRADLEEHRRSHGEVQKRVVEKGTTGFH